MKIADMEPGVDVFEWGDKRFEVVRHIEGGYTHIREMPGDFISSEREAEIVGHIGPDGKMVGVEG